MLFWAEWAQRNCHWQKAADLHSPLTRQEAGYRLRPGNSSARQRLPCRAHGRMGTYTHQYRNINRLSIAYGYYALGLGPTNPTRTFLASETLGIRRARFSHA